MRWRALPPASPASILFSMGSKSNSTARMWRCARGFETAIDGLYAIGDGAGITRGLLQASMCGVLTAQHIVGA